MRGIRCLVAALLAAGIVTMVAAQPGRQFGGGGGQDTFVLVLNNTALQEEVKITDAQKDKFKTIIEKQTELNKKVNEKYGKEAITDAKGDKDKLKELFEASGKERAKVREEIRKMIDETLTADQKKRLKQINVQVMSVNAFADPEAKQGTGMFSFGFSDSQKAIIKEVADALKLTDAQKTKIKGLVEEYGKDRDSVRKDIFGEKGKFGKVDPEKQKEFTTKSAKLSKETLGKIAEALDDNQKKAWTELVGEPFDTTKLIQAPPKKD
jgi:Spy/CpxP family protein refolding chaperone